MDVTPIETTYLDIYQFIEVSYTWCKQWNEDRGIDARTIEWDEFVTTFLDRFFSLELRDAKVQEFIKLKQGNISMKK